jgi:lysozyme
MITQLMEDLKRDEGFVPHAYQDSLGYWTIGYGFLVDEQRGGGLPRNIADIWLLDHTANMVDELERRWPSYRNLPQHVRRAVGNMAYQLGVPGLLRFRKMLEALRAGDWNKAADEALDSLWAQQTPNRAARVAALIRGADDGDE